MLPFTGERLIVDGNDVFYYDRRCMIPEIYNFSKQIHIDLNNYLGIEFEINQRTKFSKSVEDKPNKYSANKIVRISCLYDFYVDTVLKTIQLLYYVQFDINEIYTFCDSIQTAVRRQFVTDGEIGNPVLHDVDVDEKNKLMVSSEATKNDSKAFMVYFSNNVVKSGRRLQDCFKQALEKCQPFKTLIDQQINVEFPIQTFQDKIVQKEKIVVSKKKKN